MVCAYRTEHDLAFFLFSYFFLLVSFFHGLACFVVYSYLVPGTLALHLLFTLMNCDRLLFGLLCFTVVCNHRFCISLGLISMDSECTDDVVE